MAGVDTENKTTQTNGEEYQNCASEDKAIQAIIWNRYGLDKVQPII